MLCFFIRFNFLSIMFSLKIILIKEKGMKIILGIIKVVEVYVLGIGVFVNMF